MLPVEVLFTALSGLAVGSFLNVCIVRLPREESIVQPGSRCRSCSRPLRWMDNIPLLSWVLLRGRSRCCRQPISLRYPMVEAATALLFMACLLTFGLSVQGMGLAMLCWLLLGLAWMDAETYLLPDAFTLPGLALGVLYQGALGANLKLALVHSVLGALGLGGLLLAVALIYRLVRGREGMGLGDVKLGTMIGAWLGWQLAGVALFLAVAGGALAGMVMVLQRRSRKAQLTGEDLLRLPFGTFLAGAGIFTVFAGQWLLAWYLQFFP